MASFSSPGIGSGLDVNSMVSQLLSIERKPIDVLLYRQSGLKAKVSALGTLKSLVASLETAGQNLNKPTTLSALKGSVADTTVATATVGSTATAGSYALEVVKLAQSQIVNTASAPNVADGKLTVTVGANAAVDVTVAAGESLSTIASRINNDATLKTQLKASVIDNRLVLESLSTGAANTISVDGVATNGGNGLDGFDTTQSKAKTQLSMPGTMVNGQLSFAVGVEAPVNISVLATDTVTDLVNKINGDPTLSTQLNASESGGKLVLESRIASVGFTVAGQEDPSGTGLDAFDVTVAAPPAAMSEARAAQDAQVKLNGITLTRSSNTISDAITGVTLKLTKENAGTPTTLTVANDASAVTSAVEAFVKAFNDVNSNLRSSTAYDPTTKVAAALNGDSAARSVATQLRRTLNTVPSSLSGSAYAQLAKLGITTQTDGSLSFDSSKLQTAFETDPAAVVKAVAAYGAEVDAAASALNRTGGLIEGRVNGLNASVKDIDKRSVEMERRLTLTEARLKAQFSALDTLVSNMNKTSSFLTQQLANLPKSG